MRMEALHRAHWRHALRGASPVWTVCFNTRDYPGRYTARLWVIVPCTISPARATQAPASRPTRLVLVHDTLDGLRAMLPINLHPIPRDARDDPVIVETWI